MDRGRGRRANLPTSFPSPEQHPDSQAHYFGSNAALEDGSSTNDTSIEPAVESPQDLQATPQRRRAYTGMFEVQQQQNMANTHPEATTDSLPLTERFKHVLPLNFFDRPRGPLRLDTTGLVPRLRSPPQVFTDNPEVSSDLIFNTYEASAVRHEETTSTSRPHDSSTSRAISLGKPSHRGSTAAEDALRLRLTDILENGPLARLQTERPAITLPTRQAEASAEDCSICWEPAGGTEVSDTPCGHSFHASCMNEWLRDTFNRTCPMCRTRLG